MSITKSKWKLNSANAVTGSILYGTAGGGEFLMEPDDQRGVIYRFPYIVVGVGMSLLPIGLDLTHESAPGTGTRVVQISGKLSNPADFIGFFRVVTLEGNMGPGVGASVVLFGEPPFWEKGFCALAGGQVGMPGVGVSACQGYLIDWY